MLVRHLDHWLYVHRTALSDSARLNAHVVMFEQCMSDVPGMVSAVRTWLHEAVGTFVQPGKPGWGNNGRAKEEGGDEKVVVETVDNGDSRRKLNFRGHVPDLTVDTNVTISSRATSTWKHSWVGTSNPYSKNPAVVKVIGAYTQHIELFGYSGIDVNFFDPDRLQRLVASYHEGREPLALASLPDIGVGHVIPSSTYLATGVRAKLIK